MLVVEPSGDIWQVKLLHRSRGGSRPGAVRVWDGEGWGEEPETRRGLAGERPELYVLALESSEATMRRCGALLLAAGSSLSIGRHANWRAFAAIAARLSEHQPREAVPRG